MKQAVVVIHGMGEQRPMSFLKRFIDAAVAPGGPGYYSKPDRMSQSFEVRRLLVPPSRHGPQTEFYEYYWAHHMAGNQPLHLLPLIQTLMLQWPHRVSGSLRLLWALSWLVAIAVVVAIIGIGTELIVDDASSVLDRLGVTAIGASIFAFLGGAGLRWAAGSFTDVARYVDARPPNIGVRHAIRSEAVALLRRLHESGRYDRIVVVGHSLGSLIGYDVLSFLWAEMHQRHDAPPGFPQPWLAEVERAVAEGDLEAFRSAQLCLWREERAKGNPWLITDFVTVGSPLAHAATLLGSGTSDLLDRQAERELLRCPPVNEREGLAYSSSAKGGAGPRILHHAATFSVTRWTNIWFPSRFGLLGDWFGGPLSELFGSGIVERPITRGPWLRLVPLLPHTWYFKWIADDGDPSTPQGALRSALDLESWGWVTKIRAAPDAPRCASPMSCSEVSTD